MSDRTDERRKEQIRTAATRCFVRNGYSATRLLDIAREAGLSKGGVYFHYRAKEQLFADILDVKVEEHRRRWSFEPATEQSAEAVLRKLVVAHARAVEDGPEDTRLTVLLAAMAPRDPAFRTKLDELTGVMLNLYTKVIARGVDDGAFGPGNARSLAQTVLSVMHGMSLHAVADEQGRLPLPAEEVSEYCVRLVRPRANAPVHGRD